MTLVTVRVRNFYDAGILSLAITITNVFYMISCYGMRSFQASDIIGEYSDQQYNNSRLITVTIGFTLCLIFTFNLGYESSIILAISLYMLFKSIEAFTDVFHGIFQKNNRFDYICISLILKGIFGFAIFISSLYLGKSLNLALALLFITSLVTVYIYDLPRIRDIANPVFNFDKESLKSTFILLKSTFLLMISLIIPQILLSIPRIYYEKHYSSELFGIFSSLSAPTIVITTFVSSVLLPFLPQLAMYYNKGLRKGTFLTLSGFIGITVFVGVIAEIGAYFWGNPVLEIMFGKGVLPYSEIFASIILVTTLSAIIMCLNFFYIVARKLISMNIILFIGCIACYFVSPTLIDRYGMYGITHTLIISQMIQVVLLTSKMLLLVFRMKPKDSCEIIIR
ncbi:lipopolysaccharide biosynthesis protein [Desulfitobacterium sp. Sab5]|uniref:lipopolysaccharide biosynthesis protein n=1 Tax=Desulfitobacterium nosdiversum TaxID=3375356 RepID=UPI003CF113B4